MIFEYPLIFNVFKFIIVTGRFLGFFIALPIFSNLNIPARIRVLLAFAMTVVVYPMLPASWGVQGFLSSISLPYLILIMVSELIMGLVIALEVRLIMEAVSFAGQQIGRNMSFSMAIEFDPTLEEQSSIISIILVQVFTILILINDAHYSMIKLAVLSLKTVGAGGFKLGTPMLSQVNDLTAYMFKTGIQLALPIMCIIIFINIAMGIMTKFSQDFQVMMLAFPIRIGMGFFMLISIAPVFVNFSRGLIDKMIETIGLLIGL